MADTVFSTGFVVSEKMLEHKDEVLVMIDPERSRSTYNADGCIQMRLSSLDWTKEHPTLTAAVGKRLKITVTVEDDFEGDV